MGIIAKLGYFLSYVGKLSLFVKQIFYKLFTGKKDFKSLTREMIFIGMDSFFLVSLIAFFIGIIIAFQTAYQLRAFNLQHQIASLVAVSLTRELGPVLGALIVASRSGASITAQLGAMKISEQIDALDVMGVEPVNYLVVPKFISLLVSMPLLIIYADCCGIFGGYLVGALKFGLPFGFYFSTTFDALTHIDIISGLIKSICFGMVIAFISCFEGFRPNSSTEVARAVTYSVVRCFISIIVIDCILTAAFYFFN